MYHTAKEFQRLRLTTVSETRWTGTRKVILTSGEMVHYSGLEGDDASHKKGVTLTLLKEAAKSLKEWKSISGHVISARFESKWQNTTIMIAYVPMNDAEEEEKEKFYHQNQTAFKNLTSVHGHPQMGSLASCG